MRGGTEAGKVGCKGPTPSDWGSRKRKRETQADPLCLLHTYLQMIDLTVTGLNGVHVPENE
jgi:hypothetical protein